MNQPLDIRDIKDQKRVTTNRVKVAKTLLDLSQMVASGNMEFLPFGVIVIFLSPNGEEVTWGGSVKDSDLRAASGAVSNKQGSSLFPESKYFGIGGRVARRKRKDEERKQIERYEKSHPFRCDFGTCWRQFRTERGLNIHKRKCPDRGA